MREVLDLCNGGVSEKTPPNFFIFIFRTNRHSRVEMWLNRQTHTYTNPTTVTLAAHARRGLTRNCKCMCVYCIGMAMYSDTTVWLESLSYIAVLAQATIFEWVGVVIVGVFIARVGGAGAEPCSPYQWWQLLSAHSQRGLWYLVRVSVCLSVHIRSRTTGYKTAHERY